MTLTETHPLQMVSTCVGCGEVFTWIRESTTHRANWPLYHSKSCKRLAKRKRAGGRWALCPRAYKKIYESEESAWDYIVVEHDDDMTIRPYFCVCGSIHIGHAPYGESQELTPEQMSARVEAIGRVGIPQ